MTVSNRRVRELSHIAGRYPDWIKAALVKRTLVGPDGAEYGNDPPLGSATPLVIAGLKNATMVSALSVEAPEATYPTIQVHEAHRFAKSVGLLITGDTITAMVEDTGLASAPRRWEFGGLPKVGAVLCYVSIANGKAVSVIAAGDDAFACERDDAASGAGRAMVLRGRFLAAFNCSAASEGPLAGTATELLLDPDTGEVLRAR
jgi:hypothetical protein